MKEEYEYKQKRYIGESMHERVIQEENEKGWILEERAIAESSIFGETYHLSFKRKIEEVK